MESGGFFFEQLNVASEILPHLYLGSAMVARDRDAMKDLMITDVLTVAHGLPPAFPDDFNYTVIGINDAPNQDLMQHFEECFAVIDAAENEGNRRVFVHCHAGVSRSATVVSAYLMRKYKCKADEALSMVHDRRSIIDPNRGFREQLAMFHTLGFKLDAENQGYKDLIERLTTKTSSTLVVFDVLPFDLDTSIVEVEQLLRSQTKEGFVLGVTAKPIPIAYGLSKFRFVGKIDTKVLSAQQVEDYLTEDLAELFREKVSRIEIFTINTL